jgi:hypothetical protein
MDIYCPKCGEPIELDCLHDEADEQGITFSQVRDNYAVKGCEALTVYGFSGGHAQEVGGMRAMASAAMFDIMGDDVDGVASMMDDFDYLGMLD